MNSILLFCRRFSASIITSWFSKLLTAMASLDQEVKPPSIDIQKLDKTDILKLIEQWKIMPIIKSEGNDNILFLATENVIELQAKLDESKFFCLLPIIFLVLRIIVVWKALFINYLTFKTCSSIFAYMPNVHKTIGMKSISMKFCVCLHSYLSYALQKISINLILLHQHLSSKIS